MSTISLEVPDDQYAALLRLVADFLETGQDPSVSTTGVTVGSDEERMFEANLWKRPWSGEGALADAVKTLTTTTTKAWPLVSVFVEGSFDHQPTLPEIAELLGLKPATVHSYRGRLGIQAWRNGERMNPISSQMTSGQETTYFMRSEAVDAFRQAMRQMS